MTDEERTLIASAADLTIRLPSPGGQPTVVIDRPARFARPAATVELRRLVAGVNPLLGAANVLLALVAQLRATTSHANPSALREQLLEQVAEFEALAGSSGIPPHQVSAARYLLCSFIDEVIESTPWGAGGAWAEGSLLQAFHEERSGGDKAFRLLERLGEDVSSNRHLLELFYVCLALGFEGRYRGVRRGREQLDAIAERVLDAVRPATERTPTRELSRLWKPAAGARGRAGLTVLPLWVVGAIGGAVVLGAVLAMNARLERMSEPLYRRIQAAPAALQVVRPAAAARPRMAPLLQGDIAAGTLEVRDEALRSIITLPADAMFPSGTAQLDARQSALLGRVVQALRGLHGQVVVIGHTDSTPTRSLQYPSNWHLSRARAQAVLAELERLGLPPERARAEGRADVEPRDNADTAEARARNRRVEIELQLARPD